MQFGPIPVGEAVGAVLAHGVRAPGIVVRKGSTIDADTAAALAAGGIAEVIVARLDPDDVAEDVAARRIAGAIAGGQVRIEDPFTGRANLYAEADGVLIVSRAEVDALNAIDEGITFATLPAFATVRRGEMIGTVKIIPYAVSRKALNAAVTAAGGAPLISVAPFRAKRVAVVSTVLPGLKPSVVRKTLQVLQDRLDPAGARIVAAIEVAHEAGALADALARPELADCDLVVIFGASAISDRRDVVPAAVVAAGGSVLHLGMPVDPGNLLMLAEWRGRPLIGAPGCARSPKENGFDWVLARLLADIRVGREDIIAMGVGGLLMEIGSRPQPRAGTPAP
jgi:molybdenum cofactor cytidylyltransferase